MRGRRWIDKGVLERVFAELQRHELDAAAESGQPEQLGPQVGRPQLLGDRAYEGDELRALASQLGWELVAPPRATRLQPWPLNREADRARNVIER
jgi:hypothetical protein